MPFGKEHRGTPMQDVPVDYLHWVWHEASYGKGLEQVKNYIANNLDALKMENKDLIWRERL